MEKIQIQFNESDYKIYYDYCQKYYQIHDAARKQSIHAFLDLYEKGLLPVEEQEIRQARQFLSGKCDEFKQMQQSSPGDGDPTIPLRVRLCSDLLSFLDDLEKMYRLLRKQGVVPNYLMILATFSKVIEESRNSPAAGLYNLDPSLTESLATPLAEIIRVRLGTDREWRSVLQELAFIATRFNQKFSEPVFSLEIVQLVAPAVVKHFNKDVETREIVSALPSCFEECELDEFESLLNRTPEALKTDQETDIDWDLITAPLKAIADAVAEQREQMSKETSKFADPALLVSSAGNTNIAGYPVGAAPVQVAPAYKSFDIAVNSGGSTHVESPITTVPVTDASSVKSKLQPFVPVFIGLAIIVLFIVGVSLISGDWKPFGAGNATNSTSAVQKNVTAVKTTVKPTTTAAAKTTTATTKVTTAAQKTNATAVATTVKVTVSPTATPKTYTSTQISEHLMDIAFGPDNSKIVKPTKDLMAIACTGSYTDSDVALLTSFINQFNIQSSTTKLSDNIQFTGKGDILLDFLPETTLSQIELTNTTYVYRDFDTGAIYFIRTDEKIFLNADLNGNKQSRWMLRAVLYDMGFQGESAKYPDSIFYSGDNNVGQLSTIDWRAVQLMYGKKITNGMTKSAAKTLLGL